MSVLISLTKSSLVAKLSISVGQQNVFHTLYVLQGNMMERVNDELRTVI